MRLLELFCGTKSIGKEFSKLGFEIVSLDFDPQFEPDICADILTVDPASLGEFDVVWASPPCQAFSVMVIGKNWNHDHTPKSNSARTGLAILEKTVSIIEAINPKMFWIENPRGKMRKMSIMQGFERDTVSYCQYETDKEPHERRMKATDLWHNTHWTPRPMCKNGDPCHEPAPRGSKTGTQGIKGSRDRAVIPVELCREIAEYAHRRLAMSDTAHAATIGQQQSLFAQQI